MGLAFSACAANRDGSSTSAARASPPLLRPLADRGPASNASSDDAASRIRSEADDSTVSKPRAGSPAADDAGSLSADGECASARRASSVETAFAGDTEAAERDLMIWTVMSRSKVLREKEVPTIRKLAFAAACESCPTHGDAKALVLETLSESPLFSDDAAFRAELRELILAENWEELLTTLQCPDPSLASAAAADADGAAGAAAGTTPEQAAFERFRIGALAVFMRSRKVAQLPPARQATLKAAIHAATCKDDIVASGLRAIEASADLFDAREVERVTGDIRGMRYDRLLAPEALDVDEDDECAICMSGVGGADARLPCGHLFCAACVLELARRNANHVCCPICRAKTRLTGDARGTATVEVLRGYADVLKRTR